MRPASLLQSLLLTAGLSIAAFTVSAQPTMKLKVASNYPVTSLFSKVQQHYFDEVTKRTSSTALFFAAATKFNALP
jgi:hypothetical protein